MARHALGAVGEAAWFGAATVDVLVTADDTPLAPLRDVRSPTQVANLVGLMRAGFGLDPGSFPRVSQAPFAEPRAMI